VSAIACIFHTDGKPADPALIDRMTAAMDYRGPDGIAHWISGNVALGHCQMRTTAESLEEHQPLASDDGRRFLVMDGYVANYDELRAELLQRGARLRDRSDAELVLRAYETWGEDCPRHIDGEYAFVIWDAARRELFCAKDHQGLRPLYYHWDGTTVIIASDIAPILAVLPHYPRINHGFMTEMIAHRWYSNDETVWDGIMRLQPAHSMSVGQSGLRFSEYWQLDPEVRIRYKRDEDFCEHYRQVHSDCVRRASRSAGPLAFEVSGGLDSSSLFCMADLLLKQGRLPAPDIRGYTLAGPTGSDADEVAFARSVAQQTGRAITESPLFMPGLEWFSQQAAINRDMTTYPNMAMSIHLGESARADGCRSVINGLGGDQWLDGNRAYFAEQLLSGDLGGLIDSFRRDAARYGAREAGRTMLSYFARALVPPRALDRLRTAWRGMTHREADDFYWITPEYQAELERRRKRFAASLPAPGLWDYKLQKLKYAYIAINHDALVRQHARSGLEPRSPMFSRAFIEFSAATPERARLRGGVKKYLHRRALADILPPLVAGRTTKAEFSVSVTANNDELKDYFATILAGDLGPVLDRAGVEQVFEKYCTAAIDELSTWEVWGIYSNSLVRRLKPDGDHERLTP
jgi:asparagine synthase (glutamine-hydrolysing)